MGQPSWHAARAILVIEPVLERLIASDQSGSLPGRSMLANLLDVDEGMARQAGESEDGVAIFYDFAAAPHPSNINPPMPFPKALDGPSGF